MFIQRIFICCAAASCLFVQVRGDEIPHIGYVYPAGGQQGHGVVIAAGGQLLRQPQDVYVSGEGVRAEVIQWYPPIFNINADEREIIVARLLEVRNKRMAELSIPIPKSPDFMPNKQKFTPKQQENKQTDDKNKKKSTEQKALQLALLYDLDNKSLRQLGHIFEMLTMPRSRLQQNRQISETVLVKLIIEPDAAPGERELRIQTSIGLTNPMTIHIGQFAEFIEMEPNDTEAFAQRIQRMPDLPEEKPLALPFTANGQLMPGDIDRFKFSAKQGQKLVIKTDARSLVPYLADAVPGWLQATISLYDSRGVEIAYQDDYLFSPDPVMYFDIPKTGEYELSIRDSIYRGRQDFVYRITAGELPFVTHVFPLGTKEGSKTTASIEGWNLTNKSVDLDTEPGKGTVRKAVYKNGGQFSNPVLYAVDTLNQFNENEINDTIYTAQPITYPISINGRIGTKEDVDVYKFQGQAGQEIVAEVYARRLNSPMDSLVRLMDAFGRVIDFNDDSSVKDSEYLFKNIEGLLTHHADSYLIVKIPANGTYYLQVSDSQHSGGPAFGYKLNITGKTPDFNLFVTPSSLSMPAGGLAPLTVHVLRKNGFDGEVRLSLKDAPAGFMLEGGIVPAGKQSIRITLRSPFKAPGDLITLNIEGKARAGQEIITRTAIAAEDMMQAFLYRHLVASQELAVLVQKAKWNPGVIESNDEVVKVPAAGSAKVYLNFKTRIPPKVLNELDLQLQNPPEGMTIDNVIVKPDRLAFTLRAEGKVEKGFADNLIIELIRETKDAPEGNSRRSLGIISALPILVTGPSS